MTDNLGLRVGVLQLFKQIVEGGLLGGRPGVGIAALLIHAADVADADGVLVVVADMGTGHGLGTTGLDVALLVDDPVVAALQPPSGTMPAVDVGDGDFLVHSGA